MEFPHNNGMIAASEEMTVTGRPHRRHGDRIGLPHHGHRRALALGRKVLCSRYECSAVLDSFAHGNSFRLE